MSLRVPPCVQTRTPTPARASDKTDCIHRIIDEEKTASHAHAETATPQEPSSRELHWDGPADPDDPKNWPWRTRVASALIIASISLLSSFASSILVPAVSDVMKQFGVTDHLLGDLTTSLYVLGLGFGPFILAPLSELYGRWIVYTTSLTAFTLLQMGCALSNSMALLIAVRFLSGLTGGVAPSLGQASMSDLWDTHNRGRWAAVLTLGPMLGPPVGNFVASLVLSGTDWRWIFWIIMICSAVLLALTLFVLRESYEPVILRKRQRRRLRNAHILHGCIIRKQDESMGEGIDERKLPPDPSTVFRRAITRPLRFLVTSPILVIFGFFLAYTYGMLYLLLTSLPLLFDKEQRHPGLFNYNFSTLGTGLSYLGLAIGFFLGCVTQVYSQPRIWNFLTKRNGESRPEYRLLPMTVGMLFFPVSLLLYGWSAEYQAPWIVPQISTGLFGFGMFITFQSIQVYLMEVFIPYSASAISAATLLRSIAGAVFPLFGQQMFTHLGYGKGGTLLAMLALPAIPLPWILYRNGNYLRKRWAFTP